MAYKKKKSYEGQQYRGGRKKKTKNLVRTDAGTLINKHGIEFTEKEKKALEYAVNSANRKRKKMLQEEALLPRKYAGKDSGDKIASLQLMGYESDFILQPKTKSLHRFKSKEDYNRYMANLQRVNDRGYLNARVNLYKENYNKALLAAFGDDAKDLIQHIEKMKGKDFAAIVAGEEDMDINYIYEESERQKRLNRIRAAFGIDEVEYLPEENYA